MREQERFRETEPWDGHSLKDECEWVELPGGLLYDFHRLVHEFREIGRLDFYLELSEHLENFLDSGQGKPIKTLREGDVLRLEDYPKGTIVRFSHDIDEPGQFWGRRLRQSEDSWGVITQVNFAGKYYDLLVGWSFDEDKEIDPYEPEHQYTNYRFPNIVVGETIHTRIVEPTFDYIKRLLRSNKWQYLSRFNWVEIWKFGTEIREVQKARHPAELSPQLQELPRQF